MGNSFLEIYNEDLRDLLDQANPFKSISIRETPNGEVVPFGIVERVVHNAQELLTYGAWFRLTMFS